MQTLYTVSSGNLSPQARAGKLKASTEAQRKLNQKHSYQKLAAILATNFPRRSNIVTLTYSEDHCPKDRKRVAADVKAFRERAAREWKRRGQPFRMAWAIEHKHGDGRWHVHAVISRCTGSDAAIIRSLWGKGTDYDFRHLRTDKDKNHMSLAMYMSKEADDVGNSNHVWHITKNCRRPEISIESGIPDSETLQAPKGAMVIESETHSNEYGSWSYIKYYVPEDAPARTQKLCRIKQSFI